MVKVYGVEHDEKYFISEADNYEVSQEGALILYGGNDLIGIFAAGKWARCFGRIKDVKASEVR